MSSHTVQEGSTSLESIRIINHLFGILEEYGQGDYIGEPISQIEHCLQAAYCAKQAGSNNATVLAALLHDCGQILPEDILDAQIHSSSFLFDPSSPEIGTNMLLPSGRSVGKHGHDVIGGLYLASLGFPPEVWELVRDHVVAKRYLTAVEEGYHSTLSEASKLSLGFQGGPFSHSEIKNFEQDPLFFDKVQMRRFDDAAKIVGARVPPLASYKDLAMRLLQK
ncbi:hypothetical protein C8J55DRAFT_471288 [Lentinula edodes]|uniref:HD domain-containing protein n=1 Tax=Lentinula lateritia TaxID=40482 RepID=A0A9W9DUV5_9AGAR|nr:hypothetical protein C8J55DRAFT_471288 [Lentinula edodes]